MPELGTLRPYSLPGVRYVAPRTQTFTPTEIVPDTRGAAALLGSAASMNMAAETIKNLPEMLSKAQAMGRKESEQKKVHEYKMNKLAEGGTLEDFTFGADDSLTYKYTDPALRNLKLQSEQASIDYRNAAAKKALQPAAPSAATSRANRTRHDLIFDTTGAPVTEVPETTEVTDGLLGGQGDGSFPSNDPVNTPESVPQLNAGVPQVPLADAAATSMDTLIESAPKPIVKRTGPITAEDMPLPVAGPTGGDVDAGPAALMSLAETPQGQQALARIGYEDAQRGALAYDEAAQQRYAPQPMNISGQTQVAPLPEVVQEQQAVVAPRPVRQTAFSGNEYPDNGIVWESDGADPRETGERPGDTYLRRKNGITIQEWVAGGKGWKDVEDPVAKQKAEAIAKLRAEESSIIMKTAGVTAEVAENMPEEQRAEVMARAVKVAASTPEARNELTEARKRNPKLGLTKAAWDKMDDEKKSELLASPMPLSPSEVISEKNYILKNYQEKPSTIALFGANGKSGVDKIRTELGKMRDSVGGDFSKLSAQQQKAFIFHSAKLNDRDSAVLLSEYAAASDTLGAFDKIKLWLEKNKDGTQIDAKQAQDIWDTVGLIWGASKEEYLRDVPSAIRAANRIGIDPEEVGVPNKVLQWVKDQELEDKMNTPVTGGGPVSKAPTISKEQKIAEFEKALIEGVHEGEVVDEKKKSIIVKVIAKLKAELGAETATASTAAKAAAVATPAKIPTTIPGRRASF